MRSFRINAPTDSKTCVEASLICQSYDFSDLPFYSDAKKLTMEPHPLGSSLAARYGYLYIQDASSMLPALALARIIASDSDSSGFESLDLKQPLLALDMCASPGGKTSLLSRLLGPNALVVANEPSPKRLATLRHNLELLNQFNTATVSHLGQELPLPSAMQAGVDGKEEFEGFDYILLDPPCSGWGTVEKNPQVMELWKGERLGPLVGLQRLLLREAVRLLRPGGALVYSTCTTNVQENEEQIAWALNDLNAELNGTLSLEPLAPFEGFHFDASLEPLLGAPTLRVSLESGLGQGFYLAGLRKGLDAPVLEPRLAGGKKPKKAAGVKLAEFPQVSPGAIASALCDPAQLPPGRIVEQNGKLYFRHAAGDRLPASFHWRGFPLGKPGRPEPGLRGLMPDVHTALEQGTSVLNADDPAVVTRLISGQSLNLDCQGGEVGLYFRGLPLCRLKARSGRVFI